MNGQFGRRDLLRAGAATLAAGALFPAGKASATMFLDTPPKVIETRVFTKMPDEFRRKGERSAWADANRGGRPVDSFIEGAAFGPDARFTSPISHSAGYSSLIQWRMVAGRPV